MNTLFEFVELLLDLAFLGLVLTAIAALVAWQWISDWRRGWISRGSLGLMLVSGAAYWIVDRVTHFSPGWQMTVLLLWGVATVGSITCIENWMRSRRHHTEPSNET